MARKKVKLAFITNEATRRTTLKKRSGGVMKKADELSTLCGTSACVVVFGMHASQPEVWPSEAEAKRIAEMFKSLPDTERSKKKVSHLEFINQQVSKLNEKIRKQEKENRELEMRCFMLEVLQGRTMHGVSIEGASSLSWMAEGLIKELRKKTETARENAVREAERLADGMIADTPIVQEIIPQETQPMDAATLEDLRAQNLFSPGEHVISSGQNLTIQPYMPPNSSWMDPSLPWN